MNITCTIEDFFTYLLTPNKGQLPIRLATFVTTPLKKASHTYTNALRYVYLLIFLWFYEGVKDNTY